MRIKNPEVLVGGGFGLGYAVGLIINNRLIGVGIGITGAALVYALLRHLKIM